MYRQLLNRQGKLAKPDCQESEDERDNSGSI